LYTWIAVPLARAPSHFVPTGSGYPRCRAAPAQLFFGDTVVKDKDALIADLVKRCAALGPAPPEDTAPSAVPPAVVADAKPRPRKPPQKPLLTAEDFRNWRRCTVAELIGMPRVCAVRRCRRARRCRLAEAACLTAHRELAGERINILLGWEACGLFDEPDADLTW
jgi:hypothetical protein